VIDLLTRRPQPIDPFTFTGRMNELFTSPGLTNDNPRWPESANDWFTITRFSDRLFGVLFARILAASV
jgi:hypothetical protein